MTSLNPFLTDLTAELYGSKGLEFGLCHNMQYEKEFYCSCQVDYTSPYRFYSQAPYSSALPPREQYMSDMEGKFLKRSNLSRFFDLRLFFRVESSAWLKVDKLQISFQFLAIVLRQLFLVSCRRL